MKNASVISLVIVTLICSTSSAGPASRGSTHYISNRAPLAAKPYTELPIGAIEPTGWLRGQLEIMASGMTGRLDELYPQVVGPRNGWLGGDGDGWERGPYWIDGLLPLAYILKDRALIEKVRPWVEWTLTHQTEDGYIGPVPFEQPPTPEPGIQKSPRRDWWPKMVMLKVLQQYYMATGDTRVVDVMTKYFRYQLRELPKTPLGHWSFWGNRRGGDNLLVVLWLYNITGDAFLLELAELIGEQTHPYTEIFLERGDIALHRYEQGADGASAFHCVNLAQGIKEPIVYYQLHPEDKHLRAVKKAFADIRKYHGQPHGLYGADEGMHGRVPTQGSEFCTCVEMMFSLEKMLEITGDVAFADHLEKLAYNTLPTQATDDYMARQYFQQANQVTCAMHVHNFFDHTTDGVVFGLLTGYPCCTCNLHQGWPKFVGHLWMASADNGLAALVYGPSKVTAKVAQGQTVTITEQTNYPFGESVRFTVAASDPVTFALHLRVPAWCHNAKITVNGRSFADTLEAGRIAKVERRWSDGDIVELTLPMMMRTERWHENSVSIERGPLVYALRIEESWTLHDHYREVQPASPWNYALLEEGLKDMDAAYKVVMGDAAAREPWNLRNAPIAIRTKGVRLPHWQLYSGMAGPIPWSPQGKQDDWPVEDITLVPYGCSTLRISAFPTVR